jgi:hypothetical protein
MRRLDYCFAGALTIFGAGLLTFGNALGLAPLILGWLLVIFVHLPKSWIFREADEASEVAARHESQTERRTDRAEDQSERRKDRAENHVERKEDREERRDEEQGPATMPMHKIRREDDQA